MTDSIHPPIHVLFLCTGNSARSILAEALLNMLGRGRFRACSAGSHPQGQVHPQAIRLLTELGFATGDLRSKSWQEFQDPATPSMDIIITVCDGAAEHCPVWPGHPMTAHWGIPDPAAVTGTAPEIEQAFRDAYQALKERITAFVSLPWLESDPPTRQRDLNAIGCGDFSR